LSREAAKNLLLGLALGLLLLLLLTELEDMLHDLVLFDEKGTDDTLTHAVVATGSTIGTRNTTASLGDAGLLLGAEVDDAVKLLLAVTTFRGAGVFLHVLKLKLSTRGLDSPHTVGLGVVRMASAVGESLNHLRGVL